MNLECRIHIWTGAPIFVSSELIMQSRHIWSSEILSTIEDGRQTHIYSFCIILCKFIPISSLIWCVTQALFGVIFQVFLVHFKWDLEGFRGHFYSQTVSSVPCNRKNDLILDVTSENRKIIFRTC